MPRPEDDLLHPRNDDAYWNETRRRSQGNINCDVVGKVQGGKIVPTDTDPDKFASAPGWKAVTRACQLER